MAERAPDGRILVVDDEASMREMMSILLVRHGYQVVSASSGQQAIGILDSKERFDLIVTDLLMDRGGGMEVLAAVKERGLAAAVVVITAFGTAESAVEAMKLGAFDYIAKPFHVDEFIIVVRQALEHQALIRENIDLRARVRGEHTFADMIGRSASMRQVIDVCRKVADSAATVLLSGESGTGKELVARALHFGSPRAEHPFVAVNSGALPEHLMESELFGHAKGAFTGATENKIGLIQSADGGTIFFDEVGELSLPLQVKLLRVLQDRRVRPVGANQETSVDVRVVAATNRSLEEHVAAGRFRTDLFYRLNVIHIHLPRLAERREDIPVLVEQIIGRLSMERGFEPRRVSQESMRLLLDYDYPGNVRELANILERACALAAKEVIEPGDLPAEVSDRPSRAVGISLALPEGGVDLERLLESVERRFIEQALARTGGVRTQAAALLGISFRSFRYRLAKLGLSTDDAEKD